MMCFIGFGFSSGEKTFHHHENDINWRTADDKQDNLYLQ